MSVPLLFSRSYIKRILRTRPIALWPLSEPSGTVAIELMHGWNGTHTGVTLGQPGIGDGRTCPLYDGVNDYTNVWSAGLATNPANELLANGGFETAGAGGADVFASWGETTGDGAIADETSLVHGGSHACKLTAGAGRTTNVWQNCAVIPGLSYVLTFWTCGDGTNAGRHRVIDVTHGTDVVELTSTGVTGTNYAQVTVPFTVPDGCTSVSIPLRCPAAAGGIAYFDDVSLKATSGSGFNGSEGSLMVWAKVASADVWTDGAQRYAVQIGANTSNRVLVRRNGTNGQLELRYAAGGTSKLVTVTGLSTTGWMCAAIAWNKAVDQAMMYLNGTQTGDTQTDLGTWSGALAATAWCQIGAYSDTPEYVWSGNIGPVALWDRALTAGEVAALARVR